MRRTGFRAAMGLLTLAVLSGSSDRLHARGLPYLAKGLDWTSNKMLLNSSPIRPWDCRLFAQDRGLGFNQPCYTSGHTLDPDYSSSYAVGGGFHLPLNPSTVLSTSVQFWWSKMDGAPKGLSSRHQGTLADINIRALHLVVGFNTRF